MKLALATTLTAVYALPASNSTDVSQSSDRLVKQTRRFEDFKRLFEAIYSEEQLNKVISSKFWGVRNVSIRFETFPNHSKIYKVQISSNSSNKEFQNSNKILSEDGEPFLRLKTQIPQQCSTQTLCDQTLFTQLTSFSAEPAISC